MNETDRPVYLRTTRDKVLRYHDASPVARQLLATRRASWAAPSAYIQLVREACPDLPRTYEGDVADMVRIALRARTHKVAKRVPGRAA